jgi:deazaflavin-dependent oxidoreductase (nitroreductase family)
MPAPGRPARWGLRLLRTRWLVRAPVLLYRSGLGFVFGRRLLMLEHVGRVSGRRRYVVLETVDHPDPTTFVVVSGFGTRAQWYRNVVARPEVRVTTGLRRRVPAAAVPLDEQEVAETLRGYATRHPRAWRRLRGVLEAALDAPVERLPMVRLTLQLGQPGQPERPGQPGQPGTPR